MARRSGLGRGLGALIPPEAGGSAPSGSPLREVPVSAIRPNPHQPRQHFDEESLSALASSVRELGVRHQLEAVREQDVLGQVPLGDLQIPGQSQGSARTQ